MPTSADVELSNHIRACMKSKIKGPAEVAPDLGPLIKASLSKFIDDCTDMRQQNSIRSDRELTSATRRLRCNEPTTALHRSAHMHRSIPILYGMMACNAAARGGRSPPEAFGAHECPTTAVSFFFPNLAISHIPANPNTNCSP